MKNEELEEIVLLLEKGFNPQIISFELDIPEDIIIICERILKNRKNTIKSKVSKQLDDDNKNKIKSSENNSGLNNEKYIKKFEEIKHRYSEFFYDELKKSKIIQSDEEKKYIDGIIDTIENVFSYIKEDTVREDRLKYTNSILKEIKKLDSYNFTIEQSNRINNIIFSEKMNVKRKDLYDSYNYRLNDARQKMSIKIYDAYISKINELDNAEDLKKVLDDVSKRVNNLNKNTIERIKFYINTKINKLKEKIAINRYKQDLPISIIQVAQGVCSNCFNYEDAKKLIEAYVSENKKNNFKSLMNSTPEQEYDKAIMKIRSVLVNNAELFNIDNPGSTIENLIKLQNGRVENTVSTVVRHFLAKKDYEEAIRVFNTYEKKYNGDNKFFIRYGISLKKEIYSTQIKDYILDNLSEDKTPEEAKLFFLNLDRKIKENGLKISSIVIAKKDYKILTLEQLLYGKKVSKDRTVH